MTLVRSERFVAHKSSERVRVDTRTRSSGLIAFMLVGAIVATTCVRAPTFPQSQNRGLVGGLLIAAGICIASTRVRRFGFFSLGNITCVVTMTAFWLKWALDVKPQQRAGLSLYYDNSLAIYVYGLFFFFWIAAWRGGVSWSARLSGPRQRRISSHCLPKRSRGRLGSGAAGVVLTSVGLLLMALRSYLSSSFAIGVPGETPHFPGGFGRLFGALYYFSTFGPLMVIAVLLLSSRRNPSRVLAAVAIAAAYASLGISLGYRSYPVYASAVLLWSLWARRHGDRRGIAGLLVLVPIGIGTLYAVASTLKSRASGYATSGNPLEFLVGRVGGLDYLSPVVSFIDRHGASASFVRPSTWNEFLKVDVYRFPVGVANGLAGTLPGWSFAIGGIVVVGIVAVAAGALAGVADSSGPSGGRGLAGSIMHLGLLLAWTDLLLEGTIVSAFKLVLAFGLVAFLLRSAED